MKKRINFDGIVYVTKPTIDEKTSVVLLALKNYAEKENIRCYSQGTLLPNDYKLLIVAIGGDGTMLGAMRTALKYPNSYVFGINTGTLGFLSEEIATDNISATFSKIEMRDGLIEERMALSGTVIIDGDEQEKELIAINELSMVPMTLQRPLTISIDINKAQVSNIKGSGVIVATSTGSTAMALSGGGAIISPTTNVMQIVPIMAHTLTSRPIITSGRDTVTLSSTLSDSNQYQSVEIYGDGNNLYTITSDIHKFVSLKIRKHKNKIKVYRPPEWNFFNVLRDKMKW